MSCPFVSESAFSIFSCLAFRGIDVFKKNFNILFCNSSGSIISLFNSLFSISKSPLRFGNNASLWGFVVYYVIQ